jgi:hypothetical protein
MESINPNISSTNYQQPARICAACVAGRGGLQGKRAGGGTRRGASWAHTCRRSPGTLGPVRRERTDPVTGEVTATKKEAAGFDRVEIPRWILDVGIGRGAQLLACRIFSHEARGGMVKGCRKCKCPQCRKKQHTRRHGHCFRLVDRIKGSVGLIRRPLAWWAVTAGVGSTRQASTLIRQLEALGLIRRRWKKLRNAAGHLVGCQLRVLLRLDLWAQSLTRGSDWWRTGRKSDAEVLPTPLREVVERGGAEGGRVGFLAGITDFSRAATGEEEGARAPGAFGLGAARSAPSRALTVRCERCGHACTSVDPCVCWPDA